MDDTKKKAYALGIIASEMGIDFDNVSPEAYQEINALADDVLLDEPKSEIGKNLKGVIDAEIAKGEEGEYNKSFNFHTDLNENKVSPTTVFIFQLLAKYADRIVAQDKEVNGEMLSELIAKMNELGLPTGYVANPFNIVTGTVNSLNALLKGQVEHRDDEIKALAVGVKHPKFKTLSPHLASFAELDSAIVKLRDTFNLTEEDYRGKQE